MPDVSSIPRLKSESIKTLPPWTVSQLCNLDLHENHGEVRTNFSRPLSSINIHASFNPAYDSVGAVPVPKCKYYCSIESCHIKSRQTVDGLMPTDDTCDLPAAANVHVADPKDATTTVSKQTRSSSPSSGEVNEHIV